MTTVLPLPLLLLLRCVALRGNTIITTQPLWVAAVLLTTTMWWAMRCSFCDFTFTWEQLNSTRLDYTRWCGRQFRPIKLTGWHVWTATRHRDRFGLNDTHSYSCRLDQPTTRRRTKNEWPPVNGWMDGWMEWPDGLCTIKLSGMNQTPFVATRLFSQFCIPGGRRRYIIPRVCLDHTKASSRISVPCTTTSFAFCFLLLSFAFEFCFWVLPFAFEFCFLLLSFALKFRF